MSQIQNSINNIIDDSSDQSLPCPPELLFQGAEGRVYKDYFYGLPCVIKERFKKRYRHILLDKELSHQRLIAEARAMQRARKCGVDTPVLYFVDIDNRKIYMGFKNNGSLKEIQQIDSLRGRLSKDLFLDYIAKSIGIAIAKLHNNNIIHGDITPANIMLRDISQSYTEDSSSSSLTQSDGLCSTVILDFGLSFTSGTAEDKAVDLYVMERAIQSSHQHLPHLMNKIINEGYLPTVIKSEAIYQRLEEVRQRGRKRLMNG